MGYRYCPDCDQWLETAEYTVDETGETVCPEHRAVHGFIGGGWDFPWSEQQFLAEHPSWYGDRTDMLDAAKRQGLVR